VSDVWYYAERGKTFGPLPLRDLQQAIAGQSNPDDVLVWTVGFADWKRAGDLLELRSLVLRPPPVPASLANALDVRRPASRLRSVAKGALLGGLVGVLSLVFNGSFKGNLAESEFAGHYLGYLLPTTALGIIVGFIAGGRGSASAGRSRLGTVLFISVAVIVAVVSAAKIAADFPWGEGLFHPSRASVSAGANETCRAKMAAGSDAPPAGVAAFCSCFADKVADEAPSGTRDIPERVAQRATAACR
jgi:hypothetical protein